MYHLDFVLPPSLSLSLQKVDTAQLRKIQSVDGGLGVPVARNGSGIQSPKLANGTPRVPGGPTLIEEPIKKLKKPPAQPQGRTNIPASSNGVAKSEQDKGSSGEGRSLAVSTSLKSLASESSSADTSSESKVSQPPLCSLETFRQTGGCWD